jgi:TRAP-type C4-dicarboxylate transport system permease small subunit
MLSVFLALVACGMSFYVILFGALMLFVLKHPLNPPDAPHLQAALRYFAVPISVVSAIVVFLFSFSRLGKREKERAKSEQDSNKAVA